MATKAAVAKQRWAKKTPVSAPAEDLTDVLGSDPGRARVVHEWNAHRATLVSDPDAYTRDMLNRAVNGPNAPEALAAHIYVRDHVYVCAGAQVFDWSGDVITTWGEPKPRKPLTEADQSLHRAFSRSKGTFSRENQCGWIGDE